MDTKVAGEPALSLLCYLLFASIPEREALVSVTHLAAREWVNQHSVWVRESSILVTAAPTKFKPASACWRFCFTSSSEFCRADFQRG